MLTRKLFSLALSLAVTTAPLAWSASALAHGPNPEPGDPHWQTDNRNQTPPRHDDKPRHAPQRGPDRHDKHDHKPSSPHQHAWRAGNKLPPAYRDERHVVYDWHHHHLPEPPRGQRWVKVDDEFVLIAVATGIIVSVFAGH